MKHTPWSALLVASLVSILALGGAGCRSNKSKGSGLDDGGVNALGEGEVTDVYGDAAGIGAAGDGVRGKFTPVYFDYDSAIMRGGEESKLTAVADHLRSNSGATLVVEGHCDERGSNEYNLSLGDRRAMAIRSHLIGLGIDGNRINTKSLGEEMPVATGHDESAWSQNRRAEFVLY